MLVHEFTHARIDAWGVKYSGAKRIAVERACVSQEIAFVRDLPAGPERDRLLEHLATRWKEASEVWSLDAEERRVRAAAKLVGIPQWMMDLRFLPRRWRSS